MSTIEVGTLYYGSVGGDAGSSSLPCLKLQTVLFNDISTMGNAWEQRSVFNTTALINNANFGVTPAAITIPESGKYFVTSNMIHEDETAAATTQDNYRNTMWHRWSINGTAQSEESRSSYMRDYANQVRASTGISTMYDLSQGDLLRLEFRNYTGFNSPNTLKLIDNSHIMIFKFSGQ
jgi:hypothetical protein